MLLAEGEAHLWRVRLPWYLPPAVERRLSAMLPAEELKRCLRFRKPAHRRQALTGKVALCRILARYLSSPPETLVLARTPSGKPYLEIQPALHFSLSHSGRLLLVSLCRMGRMGVDAERERKVSADRLLAKRAYSFGEEQALAADGGGERRSLFFRLWTRREAVAKALGWGLQESFRRRPLPAHPLSRAGFLLHMPEGNFWVADLKPARGYSGALCVEGGRCRLSLWGWDAAARPEPRAGRSARR
jgi:4'-phosphopantetheinyl transferase